MSVVSPVIDHLEPTSKRIYLAAGVRTYHPVTDIYAEIRNLRRTNDDLRKYILPCTAAGNIPKGGGKFTPRYITLHNGWRIVPEDISHTLTIIGEQLTIEGGAGAACMDLTSLSASSKVAIEYAPSEAEIIIVTTESSGLTPEQATMLAEVYMVMGLDPTKVLTVGSNYRRIPSDGSSINQTISTDGNDVTVTRI